MIPATFKLAYTAFVAYIVVVWLRHYGWPRDDVISFSTIKLFAR